LAETPQTLSRNGPAKAAPAVAAAAPPAPKAPTRSSPPVYRHGSASPAQTAAAGERAERPLSVHERLKAILSAPSESDGSPPGEGDTDGGVAPSLGEAEQPQEQSGAPSQEEAEAVPAEADQPDDEGDGKSGDAQSEDWQPSTLEELAEALTWDSDKLFGLNAKVKIDGKEGTATLRDLVKSYQLDGHINQKLASVDTDRKALMAEREQFTAERSDKLLKLDAGVKTLERAMIGEFQSIDWQKLAANDPASYNAQLVAFQQRNAMLKDIAGQIAQEQHQYQQQVSEAQQKWLDDQRKLLQSKVPEWADESRRAKDRADIATYLNGHGITNDEFEALGDHRWALVIRDAYDMAKLRKGKPAVLNKVKAAPKLLKPGSQQSKDVVNNLASNRERDALRQSGKVRDATPVFKRLLFGARS
jgi:hypothetical protein